MLRPKTVKIFPHQSVSKTPGGQSECRMVVNVFTRYLVKAPFQVIAAFILLDLMSQAFLQIPPRLCWIGQGLLLGSFFLVCPGIFNWVQVRDLAGPLKDIQSVGLEPLLCCIG